MILISLCYIYNVLRRKKKNPKNSNPGFRYAIWKFFVPMHVNVNVAISDGSAKN